jgi:hypothetical protein
MLWTWRMPCSWRGSMKHQVLLHAPPRRFRFWVLVNSVSWDATRVLSSRTKTAVPTSSSAPSLPLPLPPSLLPKTVSLTIVDLAHTAELLGGNQGKASGQGDDHGPVLSLLRKKAMSWKDKPQHPQLQQQQQQQLLNKQHDQQHAPLPRLESEEEISPSTGEDEEERAAIASRAAKKGSPNAPKPPLAASSRGRRQADASREAATSDPKDKKKSLLSRNPRKMLGKIAARVRSRSASREPTPRSSPP